MPTISETIDDIIRQLEENTVIVTGIRFDTDRARERADEAIMDIAFARVNVRAYTDTRIQEVYDFFSSTLDTWAQSILAMANGYADGVGTGVVEDFNGNLDAWEAAIMADIALIRERYAVLSGWAQDTFDIEIPRIIAEVEAMVEEVRQNEQSILNEIDLSRQETAEMANRWRELADDIEKAKNDIIEMDYSIYEIQDSIHRNIAVEFDGRFAAFDERITVAAGEAGAVADRVEELRVEYEGQLALVQNIERALIDGDEQLALQIQSLTVGTNTQFDPFIIWHFDTTVEGWTGTWDDGFLAVGSQTQSPVVSINGSTYRQLRMRLRRVGNPTWNAALTYTGGGGAGAAGVNIPEPSWGGDLGETTVNLLWSGTVTRLGFNFGTVDAENYYEIDWVTVGRPSPGASTASVNSERIARIDADSALGARLDVIELAFTSGDGLTEVITEVIDGVRSEIIEDAVSGAVTSVNNSITLLGQRVTNVETGSTLLSESVSTLTNRVVATEEGFTAVNSEITQLKQDLDGLGNSEAISGLVQRLIDVEDTITLVNTDYTELNATVAEIPGSIGVAQGLAQSAMNLAGEKGRVFVQNAAPPVAARLPVNLWIDTTGGANTPKRWDGGQWSAVTDKVARDAAAAAAQAIAGLGNKADSSAVAALTQRVSNAENTLTAASSDLVSLNNSITTVTLDVDAAAAAAQNALTTAAGRGRVIYQPTTPASVFRESQNLWINTANNANTPMRWNGTNWVAVTDQVALDAAAAAALALQRITGKADSSAVAELTSRVSATESSITSVARDITSLSGSISSVDSGLDAVRQAAVDAAAVANSRGRVFFQSSAPAAADRLPQNLWIYTGNNANQPRRWDGTAWVAVSDKVATDAAAAAAAAVAGLATKASVSAVNALDTRVTTLGSTVTSVASRTNTLESRLNHGTTGLSALSNSINQTRTQVTNIGTTVTSMSSSIQSLSSSVGNMSANNLLRFQAVATPAGALSRVAIKVAATAGEGMGRAAAMYMEARSGNVSHIIFEADRFAILNSQNGIGLTWANGAIRLTDETGALRMVMGRF